MKKIQKIFIIILMLISIFNIYKIIDCHIWINSKTMWDGGLGVAQIYILGFILALVLQIINILLLLVLLKCEEKINKIILISILIIVGTFFIPIYKFPVLYPYNNLYHIAIFKI